MQRRSAKREMCSLPGCTLMGTGSCFFCSDTTYCSEEHQIEDWPIHKKKCFPYERRTINLKDYGSCTQDVLRASRDLSPGQHVMIDKPAVTFPNIDYSSPEFTDEHGFGFIRNDYQPLIYVPLKPEVCFGCYKVEPDGLKYQCAKCEISICSSRCGKALVHQEECGILAHILCEGKGYVHPAVRYLYMDISTLRILLLKRTNEILYKRVMELALDPRVVSYRNGRNLFHSIIRISHVSQFLPISSSFTEDVQAVLDACVIALVMGHVYVDNHITYKCIYPVISGLSHSCVPNMELLSSTRKPREEYWEDADAESIIAEENVLTAVATTPISTGTILTIDLVPKPFLGKLERQEILRRKCVFRCSCPRCLSPTDLGTFANAVKCSECVPGYLLPQRLALLSWTCLHCGTVVDSDLIYEKIIKAMTEFTRVMSSGERWEDLRALQSTWKLTFHPNHYLILIAMREEAKLVEKTIMNGLGALKVVFKYSLNISAAKYYAQMRDHCNQLLRFLNVSRPGYTISRGKILRQLFFTDFVIGVWKYKTGRIKTKAYQAHLKRGIAVLRESCVIIDHHSRLQPSKNFYTTELMHFLKRIETTMLLFSTRKSNYRTVWKLLNPIVKGVLKLSLENEQLLDLN